MKAPRPSRSLEFLFAIILLNPVEDIIRSRKHIIMPLPSQIYIGKAPCKKWLLRNSDMAY